MPDDTQLYYIAHGFYFSTEPQFTADNVLAHRSADLVGVPYRYNVLPVSVAARTDISPLAKVLYADRLSFLRMARKNHKTSQENGNPNKFQIPYASWEMLEKRLCSSGSKIIAAAKQLVDAGLMSMNKSSASAYRCNTFEPLFYHDPELECFDEEPPKKIPNNGAPWTESLLCHIRFLPLLIPTARSDQECQEHALWKFLNRTSAKETLTNTMVYALVVKTARPCCYLTIKEMARNLGMNRHTVSDSLSDMCSKGLLIATRYFKRYVYSVAEHPYMETNDAKRETECAKLEAAIADGTLFGGDAVASDVGDTGPSDDAENYGGDER